jgi:hypothetical protein
MLGGVSLVKDLAEHVAVVRADDAVWERLQFVWVRPLEKQEDLQEWAGVFGRRGGSSLR